MPVLQFARSRQTPWLQIDFEARASQRQVVLDLLHDVRAGLPATTRLSMTALASWCDTETWLATAPVDEIVPMLFRMGPTGGALRARVGRGRRFRRAAMSNGAGDLDGRADPSRAAWPPGISVRSEKLARVGLRQRSKKGGIMGRRLRTIMAGILAMATFAGGGARASGPGELSPWYIDQFGGPTADLAALYGGRLGIVMMRSPRPQLYIAWRILHGQRVGAAAGAALSIPCCDAPQTTYVAGAPPTGVEAWLAARKLVPRAPDLAQRDSDRTPGAQLHLDAELFPGGVRSSRRPR